MHEVLNDLPRDANGKVIVTRNALWPGYHEYWKIAGYRKCRDKILQHLDYQHSPHCVVPLAEVSLLMDNLIIAHLHRRRKRLERLGTPLTHEQRLRDYARYEKHRITVQASK